MTSFYKRKNKNGSYVWRAVIRIKGYPTLCKTAARKQELLDWVQETERQIKNGQFNFNQHKNQRTFKDLANRFIQDGIIEHHKSSRDTLQHLKYWESRLSSYALVHMTTELISKERKLLLETPSAKGKLRASATINRYMATLSTLLTYAVRELKWINQNPCFYLSKLKENPGRDRVLSEDEITRLLHAAAQSKSPYLYCIILLSLATGARQGELLNLEWKHIDFDRKIAYIKESKNGHPRSIALCQPVIEELKKLYKNRDPKKILFLQVVHLLVA